MCTYRKNISSINFNNLSSSFLHFQYAFFYEDDNILYILQKAVMYGYILALFNDIMCYGMMKEKMYLKNIHCIKKIR